MKKLVGENQKFKDDRLMDLREAMEYTGFGRDWVLSRKADFGYFQDGKDLRFRTSTIDSYIQKNFIQRKFNDNMPRKKKVPLWKDEAAIAQGMRQAIIDNNNRLLKKQAANENSSQHNK